MDGNNDMRVKFEYQGERRILPVARPVMIEQLQSKIKITFGEELGINYENGEVYIPIVNQSDLDKAIALLDQSPHLTSLRLTLTPKTLTEFVPEQLFNGHYENYNDYPNLHPSLEERLSAKSSYDEPTHRSNNRVARPLPIRSRSNPEEMASSPEEDLIPIRSHSMFIPPHDDAVYGHSPPPGHHPLESKLPHHLPEIQNGGGVFIPEDFDPEDNHNQPPIHRHDYHPIPADKISYGFDPLSPKEADYPFDAHDPLLQMKKDQRMKESLDSLLGSLSPLSTSHMSIASEDATFYRNHHSASRLNNTERRRPLSDLIPDTVTMFEYDSDGNTSLKSEPYPKSTSKPRHRSEWNLTQDSVDSSGTYRWMDRYRDMYFPPINRTTSNSSIGQSSNSSGLVPDCETRHDLTDKVNKLSLNTDINFRWKQCRQLGAGAFGTVYLCVDLDTGKEMAMKCVETGVINAATLKEVEVLQREMQLYKTLKHERIVNYYGTIQDARSISIFMEFMEGGSIHDRLSREGAFTEEETSKYCQQILEGLAYLHTKNIIHRDIKGANILLDNSNNCKLADFGSSRQIQTIRSKTGCKSVHGTPYWMSPEVINGEGYGRKADIWSLGCAALEMLTTKPPWFQYEPMAALFKIATQPTCPHFPSDVTNHCKYFINECLQRDPQRRPSALELLHYNFVQS